MRVHISVKKVEGSNSKTYIYNFQLKGYRAQKLKSKYIINVIKYSLGKAIVFTLHHKPASYSVFSQINQKNKSSY